MICAFCGFTLDIEKGGKPDTPRGVALIAEDSQFTRRIIEKLIREKHFSEKVIAVENGLELVSTYGRLLSERVPIDVAIIDLNMPVMDGLTAARTVRALEEQKGTQRGPVVFFSAVKADENLRQQMELLEPANYVNKGGDADPEKLITRVEMLLSYLMEKYRQPAV